MITFQELLSTEVDPHFTKPYYPQPGAKPHPNALSLNSAFHDVVKPDFRQNTKPPAPVDPFYNKDRIKIGSKYDIKVNINRGY